jgi:hypothetical protein
MLPNHYNYPNPRNNNHHNPHRPRINNNYHSAPYSWCGTNEVSGIYQGDGTTCDPNPCIPVPEIITTTTTTIPVPEIITTTTLPFAGFPTSPTITTSTNPIVQISTTTTTTIQTSITTKSTSTTLLSTSTSTTPTQLPILDSDSDGWSDPQELKIGTNPDDKDTDGDGYWDPNDPNPLDPNIPEKLKETIEKQTGFMERISNLLEKIFNKIFGRDDN